MTDQEYLARAAIKQTMAIAAQAGDARKAEIYADCFTEDGVLILNTRYEGREAIRAWMSPPGAVAPPPATSAPGTGTGFISHHLTTCRINLTSETSATAKTYFFVVTAIGPDHSGYYDDVFVKEPDAWRIASRKPRTVWVSPQTVMARGG